MRAAALICSGLRHRAAPEARAAHAVTQNAQNCTGLVQEY